MSKLQQWVQSSNWDQLRLCLGFSQSSFQCSGCNKSSPYFKCANCSALSMSSYASHITKSDRNGRTPFHYACAKTDAPSDIIRSMLELSTPKNSVLYQQDNEGNIPLHGACATGSLSTVKALLWNKDAGNVKEMVRKKNVHGFTAMDVAWKKYLVGGFVLFDEAPTDMETVMERISHVHTVGSIDGLDKPLKNLWGITGILLYALKYGTSDTLDLMLGFRKWRILHEIAASGGDEKCCCPTVVLCLAISLFPMQAQEQDELGFLPLHHAASSPTAVQSIGTIEYEGLENGSVSLVRLANKSAIEILIEHYPKGARVPDKEGRLPLNLAIERRQNWDDGVGALIKAAPQALAVGDVKTHMYPFMLAQTTVEGDCLDFVFHLLRQNPEVVKIGIKETKHETYLTRKLGLLKTQQDEEIASLRAQLYQMTTSITEA